MLLRRGREVREAAEVVLRRELPGGRGGRGGEGDAAVCEAASGILVVVGGQDRPEGVVVVVKVDRGRVEAAAPLLPPEIKHQIKRKSLKCKFPTL